MPKKKKFKIQKKKKKKKSKPVDRLLVLRPRGPEYDMNTAFAPSLVVPKLCACASSAMANPPRKLVGLMGDKKFVIEDGVTLRELGE